MARTSIPLCPTCQRAVVVPEKNPCFPFCSERCRTIDLGRWLSDGYRIPVKAEEDEDGASLAGRREEG